MKSTSEAHVGADGPVFTSLRQARLIYLVHESQFLLPRLIKLIIGYASASYGE